MIIFSESQKHLDRIFILILLVQPCYLTFAEKTDGVNDAAVGNVESPPLEHESLVLVSPLPYEVPVTQPLSRAASSAYSELEHLNSNRLEDKDENLDNIDESELQLENTDVDKELLFTQNSPDTSRPNADSSTSRRTEDSLFSIHPDLSDDESLSLASNYNNASYSDGDSDPQGAPLVSSSLRASLVYDFMIPPPPAEMARSSSLDADAFLSMLAGIPAAHSYFGINGVYGQCSSIPDRRMFWHLAGRTCPKVEDCPPYVCRYMYGQMKRFSNSSRPEYRCHVPSFARRAGAGLDRPSVLLVNASEVTELLYSDNLLPCVLVNFYSTTCPFSAHLAPNFNALPRAFDQLTVVAVDVSSASKINTRFGISGTPTVLLFHRGKAVVRYNASDYSIMALKEFIEYNTDLLSFPDVEVEDMDMFGPLQATIPAYHDPWLYLAWVFIVVCVLYHGSRSAPVHYVAEVVRRNWQEANENAM